MKRFDDDELGAALRELRPDPSPEFAAELDERAAAGFPRRQPEGSSAPFVLIADWLRRRGPRGLLIPVGGAALALIAITTAVVVAGESDGSGAANNAELGLTRSPRIDPFDKSQSGDTSPPGHSGQPPVPDRGLSAGGAGAINYGPGPVVPSAESGAVGGAAASTGTAEAESTPEASAGGSNDYYEASGPAAVAGLSGHAPKLEAAPKAHERKVERSAEIVIGTKPGEVGSASSKVFQAVHAYDGIVLNSSTRDGSGTGAEASFELLIPSARIGDAMAAFSRIGEVRSRHEATEDITAPTVGAEEKLADSQARIDSLLGQLREAGEEGERELVEAELRSERRHSANLKSQLDQLDKRASLSRVSVRVESGRGALSPAGPDDGKWGVGDALHSAGRVLAVAAGVIIVGAAVLAPIALLLLLAWLAGRAWSRRARERALS